MFSSNTSLHYLDYPTQVIGKSIKPIPVMLLNVIWARKRYPWKRYLFVLMISSGVILFIYKGGKSPKVDAPDGLGWGHLLLVRINSSFIAPVFECLVDSSCFFSSLFLLHWTDSPVGCRRIFDLGLMSDHTH